MENQQQAPASVQASDTASLADELRQRRDQLGIADRPGATLLADLGRRILERQVVESDQAELAEAEARKKRREHNERLGKLIRQAGERYANCRLENFVIVTDSQRKVAQACLDYLTRPNKTEGLVLYGPCGTGKDHLAFAIAGQLTWEGASVEWMYGQDWFGQVRDAMDGDTTEASLVRYLCHPDITVISDPLPPIGNLTPHQATMLYRVVQGRYQSGKPTIVTVNVSSDQEADERLGVPTWDRLCDGAWKIQCNWPSHRKPAREVR